MSERRQAFAMAGAEFFLATAWAIDVFFNPLNGPAWVNAVGLLGIVGLVIAAARAIVRALRLPS